jgi:hypothetical protein
MVSKSILSPLRSPSYTKEKFSVSSRFLANSSAPFGSSSETKAFQLRLKRLRPDYGLLLQIHLNPGLELIPPPRSTIPLQAGALGDDQLFVARHGGKSQAKLG